MSKLRDAIKEWEQREQKQADQAEKVDLIAVMPPIERMDSALQQLKSCTHLSLSTNNIEKIGGLAGLKLQILSLGRNQIKRIEGLDAVSETLEQLWISYNLIERLAGIERAKQLRVLYISNNKIERWSEFERLKDLPNLEELVFTGNPLEKNVRDKGDNWRVEVLKRLPNLKRLDGTLITDKDRELLEE